MRRINVICKNKYGDDYEDGDGWWPPHPAHPCPSYPNHLHTIHWSLDEPYLHTFSGWSCVDILEAACFLSVVNLILLSCTSPFYLFHKLQCSVTLRCPRPFSLNSFDILCPAQSVDGHTCPLLSPRSPSLSPSIAVISIINTVATIFLFL